MKKYFTFSLALLLMGGLIFTSCKTSQGGGGDKKKDSSAKGGDDLDPKIRQRVDYLFVEANTQYLQENKRESINIFKQILEIDPKNHASMYNIAKIASEIGDYDMAIDFSVDALDLEEDNYWYYQTLESAYEMKFDFDQALEIQEKIVDRFPKNRNARFDLAQLYIRKKKFPEAVEVYNELESFIGMNEEVVFRKHQLYIYLNDPEKAEAELDKLISFNPNEPRYLQAKYDLYTMIGEEDKAFAMLERILEFNPGDGFALLSLADYYRNKGEIEKSDQFLFKAFENPDIELDAKVKILGGMYPYAETDAKVLSRMKTLTRILSQQHPSSALVYGVRGDLFQVENLNDSARFYYKRSVKSDPSNEQVWQELLYIDSESGDFNNLKKDAESALEYYPNSTLFLYFFGIGSMEAQEYDEALYAFEKIRKIGSDNKDLMEQTWLNLGEIYNRTKEYEKSDESFEKALEFNADNAVILNNYAYYLSLRNEKLGKASEMIERALKLEPGSGAYQDTYGWILYLQGDYEGAEKWIGKALENGGSAEVLEHYGDVWLKLGDKDKAIEYWNQAKEKGAKDLVIDDKLKN